MLFVNNLENSERSEKWKTKRNLVVGAGESSTLEKIYIVGVVAAEYSTQEGFITVGQEV